MTTDEALQNLRGNFNKIISVLKNDWKGLLFLTIAMLGIMITVSYFTYRDAQQYYEPQIEGLQRQLSRTQKQLKRASDDRARQTKRIAELTGNGGQGMIDEILKRLNKEFDNDLDNYGQESYAGYMAAIGVAIEIVEEVKRGSK